MNHAPTLCSPALSPGAAALLAQLARRTTLPAEDLDAICGLLLHYRPGHILAKLDQAVAELATEGCEPAPHDHDEAAAYLLLVQGLGALDQSLLSPVCALAA